MSGDGPDGMQAAERGRWAVAAMFAVNGVIMGAWAAQIPLLMPRHDILEGMVGLIILALGVGAVGTMLLDWAAIFIQKDLGASLAVAGLGYAAVSLMMAAMRFAGDRVRDRFGAVRTLQISGLAGALGMAIAAAAPQGWAAILGFAISGIGIANMVPILFSAAGNMPGLTPGAGIATVTMMGFSGILVAPSTIGFVAQHVGFRLTFGVLAVILLVVVALAGKVQAADPIQRAA
jgi:MFS family permease